MENTKLHVNALGQQNDQKTWLQFTEAAAEVWFHAAFFVTFIMGPLHLDTGTHPDAF